LYVRRAAARGSLVVGALLVLALLGGSSLVLWTQASIASSLQRNWRGSYDLLVLPATGSGAVLNEGYVEPNFAAYSKGGISVAQWRRIRSLPGVSVAAPVAFLGQLQSPAYDVTLSWQGQPRQPLFCGRRPKALRAQVPGTCQYRRPVADNRGGQGPVRAGLPGSQESVRGAGGFGHKLLHLLYWNERGRAGLRREWCGRSPDRFRDGCGRSEVGDGADEGIRFVPPAATTLRTAGADPQ
jgi:hypothetical protein